MKWKEDIDNFINSPKKLFKILQIIFFIYWWEFFNTLFHESGHVLAFNLLGYGYSVISMDIGWGPWGISFSNLPLVGTINFKILRFWGITKWFLQELDYKWKTIFVDIMGMVTQFIFLYLIYLLLKKKTSWQETTIGYFCYYYAIKLTFCLTLLLNFIIPGADGWKIIQKIFN
jgi:hypothetical protein